MSAVDGPSRAPRSPPFGVRLLESVLNDGLLSKQPRKDSENYYHSRVEGKRILLGNLDRAAPIPKVGSTASKQIQKRTQRLVKKYSKLKKKVIPRDALKKEEARPLSRRERKAIGLDGVGDISYEDLLPIHQLWTGYIQRLLGFLDEDGVVSKNRNLVMELSTNPNAISSFQNSLIKADFCGASIRVTKSLNPSLVGIEGLIAKETESTFIVVTKSKHSRSKSRHKCVKTIPKENSNFLLSIPVPVKAPKQISATNQLELQVPLYGDQLCNTMQTRATKKFKARRTIDL